MADRRRVGGGRMRVGEGGEAIDGIAFELWKSGMLRLVASGHMSARASRVPAETAGQIGRARAS